MQCTNRRCLFQTEYHFMGYGPESLVMGDQVWIMLGANVPLLLRQLPNGRHQVTGEAYIHGLMHGEALRRGDFKLQDIVLE